MLRRRLVFAFVSRALHRRLIRSRRKESRQFQRCRRHLDCIQIIIMVFSKLMQFVYYFLI